MSSLDGSAGVLNGLGMRRHPEPSSSSHREALAGLVERVTFHNADNGFCVLRVKARG